MEFMPHGHCYFWTPELVWLQVLSNGAIGVAYVWIAVELTRIVRSLEIPFGPLLLAFGAFILLCGLTHFMDVLVIWEPRYWLDGSIRALTAFVSLGTALALPSLLPKARRLLADAASHRAALEAHADEIETQSARLAQAVATQLDEAREALLRARDVEIGHLEEALAAAHERIATLEAREP